MCVLLIFFYFETFAKLIKEVRYKISSLNITLTKLKSDLRLPARQFINNKMEKLAVSTLQSLYTFTLWKYACRRTNNKRMFVFVLWKVNIIKKKTWELALSSLCGVRLVTVNRIHRKFFFSSRHMFIDATSNTNTNPIISTHRIFYVNYSDKL